MTLPIGQVWAWPCEMLKLVKYAAMPLDEVRGPRDFDVMPADVFQHIFGFLPKPGQAVLVDNKKWVRYCSCCQAKTNKTSCCGNPTVYHVRVLAFKELEEGK